MKNKFMKSTNVGQKSTVRSNEFWILNSGRTRDSKLLRNVARVMLFIFLFVWCSPSVYAAVFNGDKSGRSHNSGIFDLDSYVFLLEDTRNKLIDHIETPSSFLEEVQFRWELKNIFSDIDKKHHEYLNYKKREYAVSEKIDNEIGKRVQARISNYQRGFSEFKDSVNDYILNFSRIKSPELAKKIIDKLSSVGFKTPQSYDSGLDVISPATRSVYLTQTQIDSMLGLSNQNELSDSEYLKTDSATEITPEIENLVFELNNHPITIYNWVYDNITWIPHYGVMQSADYTLQIFRGNAFDISSLLISLFRAADYPARYKYGTVGVNNEELKKWLGGVTEIDAATNLMTQGGIPTRKISYGGSISETEFEHVWVQVKVNGEWIDVDPSLKTMNRNEGINLESEMPFDMDALVNQLEVSSTVNETQGWVEGITSNEVLDALKTYQVDLENYVLSNLSDATLDDVIGSNTIVPSTANELADVKVPYLRQLVTQTMVSLPKHLFYHFNVAIGNTLGQGDEWGNTEAEYVSPTTELLGKSLSISFRPATTNDALLLTSYLPEFSSSIDDMPNRIPAGDVQMIGEITVDGAVVANTGAHGLGDMLMTRFNYLGGATNTPELNINAFTENYLVVGQYQALVIDTQGISGKNLDKNTNKMAQAEAVIYSGNSQEELTKHDIIGNYLHSIINSYFLSLYTNNKIVSESKNVIYFHNLGYGTFSNSIKTTYLFGSPAYINFGGFEMDIDRVSFNSESRTNCYEDWFDFNQIATMQSSLLEHEIPELLMSTENEELISFSTIKIITEAANNGQKIYYFTESNQEGLSSISLRENVKLEIKEALQSGFHVLTHESPFLSGSWSGAGYSIIHKDYGIGPQRISGGFSGSQSLQQKQDNFFGVVSFGLSVLSSTTTAIEQWRNIDNSNSILGPLLSRITKANSAMNLLATIGKCKKSGKSPTFEIMKFTYLSIVLPYLLEKLTQQLFVGVVSPFSIFAINLIVSQIADLIHQEIGKRSPVDADLGC